MTATSDRYSPTAFGILAAATSLFLEQGPQPVSADRVMVAATVSKVTFYRHFRTKNDLVVAYIDHQSQMMRSWVNACVQESSTPEDAVVALINASIRSRESAPFLGNLFVIAMSQYANPEHPVNLAVNRHHEWLHERLSSLLLATLGDSASATAIALCSLRNGVLVAAFSLGESAERWIPKVVSAIIAAGTPR